jgi:glucan phosphoethanolaminetransferase (alkaline phosphatase superfamily)
MTTEKLYTLLLVIPAILIYSILLYLHVLLYVDLPKKLSGVKTILYFIYFVFFWIVVIYLLTEEYINFAGATLLIALSCVPGLFILREKVVRDMRMLADRLHLRK